MIKVLNGSLVTTTANEEAIVPFYINEDGEHKVAGRHTFFFVLVSGSVKTLVGESPTSPTLDGITAATWSTAGDKWFHTASPEADPPGFPGVADVSKRNIRAVGAATFNIFW
jgi:hypothetical protein